jgi:hypothetical protein
VSLVIEIKGGRGRIFNPDAVPAKSAASKKWCAAVSNVGTYGSWTYTFCDAKDAVHSKQLLRDALAAHGHGAVSVPYSIIEQGHGKPGKDCVPVISLRTISSLPTSAMDGDLFHGTIGYELATWEGHLPFEADMFVAKVFGDAMHPTIPANAYCLFRRVKSGFESNGAVVLVRDAAIHDPHTGGIWTVRRCLRSKNPSASDGQMQYTYELRPDNDTYESMILTVSKPENLDVRAEFVAVVGG